jgi:alginate O-acetyltransferase complex protein AlgI
MVFTSTVFLFAFLPVALITFYLFPATLRPVPLLVLSSLFYGWGEPVLVVLILVSSVFNYVFGRILASADRRHPQRWLVIGIAVNLLPLLVFKYLDFLLLNLGFAQLAHAIVLPLPIGVSFYTFMAISYLVDIYRRRNTGAPSLLTFAAYLTMFPHLVAGPIVRWGQVGPQLLKPRFDAGLFGYGAVRISTGLVKKAVLADSLSPVVDAMFLTGAPTSWGSAWVAALLYSLQIYLDFSAYSDIAIGLAAMLGVRFEENFRYPYLSRSAREFWQRWHISLGSWFRDYVYIPMGGSRVGRVKLWRNLIVVWALTGLWHGAAWTFIVWGLYYGVLIGLERGRLGRAVDRLPRPAQHLYGVLVAVLGWVLFRSVSFTQAIEYYRAMLGLGGVPVWDARASYAIAQTAVVVVIATALSFGASRRLMDATQRLLTAPAVETHSITVSIGNDPGPAGVSVMERDEPGGTLEVEDSSRRAARRRGSLLLAAVVGAMLLVSTAFVVAVTYSPFIYFRF